MLLKIPTSPRVLIHFQIIFICFVFGLISFGSTSTLTYVTDAIMLCAFVKSLGRIQSTFKRIHAMPTLITIVAIIAMACLGAIINSSNFLLFLWGARNNFRFFIFFISCIILMSISDLQKLISFLKSILLINVPVVTVQYFMLNIKYDYCGGLFGTNQGCNIYANILICIITAIVLAEYLYGKISAIKIGSYIIACIYWATLAELKVYYVELIMVIVLCFLIKKPSLKTFGIICVGAIMLLIGIQLLMTYNPSTLNILLDKPAIDNYLAGGGYTNKGDLNRFTAIEEIYDRFFRNSAMNNLFGFGLGSCDTSNYSFFQSEFFEKYSYLHYRWFTHAWVYLEQGAIGLVLLLIFFITIIRYVAKFIRKVSNPELMVASILFCFTTILGMIYNCGLEVEACYMIALFTAIPYIVVKDSKMLQ